MEWDFDWIKFAIVIASGIVAGFFNTVAGGGSLLTLPILIMYIGLPASIANATNRVAIFSQNIFAIAGFKSKGISDFKYGAVLGISALLGAIIGAKIAIEIKGELFNKILAVIMVLIVIQTVIKSSKPKTENLETTGIKQKIIATIIFFFIGIYGGFIQAGVGFLIIAALTSIHRFSLSKTNALKVFIVLVYTVAALSIFIIEDQINWVYGLVLAIGNSIGAWFASRWSVKKGDKIVGRILIIAVTILAIKLWFF